MGCMNLLKSNTTNRSLYLYQDPTTLIRLGYKKMEWILLVVFIPKKKQPSMYIYRGCRSIADTFIFDEPKVLQTNC